MKKRYLTMLSAMTMMAPVQLVADVEIHTDLLEVSKKVDTDGDFFQLNRFDGDLKVLAEYGDLAVEGGKKLSDEIPADVTFSKILKHLGADQLQASAVSSKKVGAAWNNSSYLYTGGSNEGLLSLIGEEKDRFNVVHFAPEGTDLAVEMRLDTRSMEEMLRALANLGGQKAKFDQEIKKPRGPKNIVISEILSKLNVQASIAIDIDPSKRQKVGPGMDLPGAELIARIDNAAWLWPLIEDDFLKNSGLPWKKSENGTEIVYSLPADFADQAMGYSPVVVVDNQRKYLWLASKASVLKKARSSAPKLKSNKEFRATLKSLPKRGNGLAYFSEELLSELAHQYKLADKNGMLDDKDFQMMKPVVDELVKDLFQTDSGIAAVIAKDEEGVLSVLRAPFATKNYLDQIMPIVGSAMDLAK